MPVDPSVVATICEIPRAFKHGNRSPLDLVAQSGFASVRDALTVEDIRTCLEADRSLIEEWELWSMDKRTSGGFSLERVPRGGCVTWMGANAGQEYFSSFTEACAQFVIREVSHLAMHLPASTRGRELGANGR